MRLDKSRVILAGTLFVLFLTLLGGDLNIDGFAVVSHQGWVKLAIIAFMVWLLTSGCCSHDADEDDNADLDDNMGDEEED